MNDSAKNARPAAQQADPGKNFAKEVENQEKANTAPSTPDIDPAFLRPAPADEAIINQIDPSFLKPDEEDKASQKLPDIDPSFLKDSAQASSPFGEGIENPGRHAAVDRAANAPSSGGFDPSAPAGLPSGSNTSDPASQWGGKEAADDKKKAEADARKDRSPKALAGGAASAKSEAGAKAGAEEAENDNPWGKKSNSENPALAQRPKAKDKDEDKDPLKNDKDPALKKETPAPAAAPAKDPASSAAENAGGALGSAAAAKELMAKDPNAGAGGMKAKAAGALQGAQAAIDGFNEDGMKGAALKGAAGARKGAAAANAKAANAQQGAQNGKASGAVKAGAKLAISGTKAAIIGFLTGITGVPPEVWAKLLSPKILLVMALVVLMPAMMVAGLFLNGQGAAVPVPDEASDRSSNEYIPLNWQEMLIKAAETTRRDDISVPWTILAGTAKATTDFGRTSPYDETPIDHDKDRREEGVKDSPDPENPSAVTAAPAAGTTVSEGLGSSSTEQALTAGTLAADPFSLDRCQVRRPDPAIGGEKGQARGPFLLTEKAWKELEEEGLNPDIPCDVAPWLAKKFSATAKTMLEDNPELVSPWSSNTASAYPETSAAATTPVAADPASPSSVPADPERDADAKFWAEVVSTSGLIQDPSGKSGEACTVAPAADGTEWPIAYLIDQIWNCEFSEVDDLHVVTSMDANLDGKAFVEVSSTYARIALIAEAEQVSYGFSKWDNATCDKNAAVAGIFPLDAGTAGSYGAPDRCDVQLNIRAAARAVIATESLPASERPTDRGPYQPMLGGWLSMPGAFGTDLPALLKDGPSSVWKNSATCKTAMDAYVPTVLGSVPAGEFASIGAGTTELDMATWQPKMDAVSSTATLEALRVACGAPPESIFYQALGTHLKNWGEVMMSRIAPSLTPGIPYVPSNPFAAVQDTPQNALRLVGLGTFLNIKAETILAAYPAPTYGQTSLLGNRLSIHPVQAPIGETASSKLSTAITPVGTKAAEYAIFYGGTSEPFDSVGLKVGSLVAPLPGVVGGGLAPGQIPEHLVALFMAAGQRCPLITPAVLAAQAKAESGFRSDAKSPVGAAGISQFMPKTWEAVAIDGDGDGIRDVFNPADAIPSQAKYMCDLAAQYAPGKTTIPGDQLDLTLAAYNAGSGNVRKYNGVPPFTETQNYLTRIKGYVVQFSAPAAAAPGAAAPGVVVPVGSGKWVTPLVGPQRSQFGMRFHPILKINRLHAGIDISPGCDVPIKSAGDGTVKKATKGTGQGNYIVVDHGGGITTTYMHMPDGAFTVSPGQVIGAGTVIGRVGTTGSSTACHLHFEVALNGTQVNPVPFMAGQGVVLGVG